MPLDKSLKVFLYNTLNS